MSHLLYPALCAACEQPLSAGTLYFCAQCRHALITDRFATCPRCAGTVGPFTDQATDCLHCRGAAFSFEKVLRLGPYEDLLRELIIRLKYPAGEMLAEVLGRLWAEHAEQRLRSVQAAVVVPIPLHWRRRWERGFNQSAILAHSLARRLGLPCRPNWLRRTRYTAKQTLGSLAERRDNVRGAFRAVPGSHGKDQAVLLVDDVMTTGSTVDAAARALRQAGARRVVVAVLARATG
ncbi:MAG: ComF family protein [Gemmataceae bacterium]